MNIGGKTLEKLFVIDGNSILNRAFYGTMSSRLMQTSDGTYTNAVYGFLAILFKELDDIKPEYIVVSFDVKAPTKRHEMYKEYKGTRKGMPDELASQMPLIKRVLTAMNIKIIEKEGYEADDILGTLSRYGESQGLEVILLTGDRDSFQLATDKTIIRIPHTKQGKTETEEFDKKKILEVYGVEPKALIEVKGLMGDTSDNIPGVSGIGEKTALSLIKEYGNIDNLYKSIEDGNTTVKGKTKEKLENGKEMAYLSRTLGTINVNSPIEKNLEDFRYKDWNKQEVLKIFQELRFNRYIERFNLLDNTPQEEKRDIKDLFEVKKIELKEIYDQIVNEKILYYYFESIEDEEESHVRLKFKSLKIAIQDKVYSIDFEKDKELIKKIFENVEILKCGYEQKLDYILLKQSGIEPKNIMFDVKIAAYLLNSSSNQYDLEELSNTYLDLNISSLLKTDNKNTQTSLFDNEEKEEDNIQYEIYAYLISKLHKKLEKELDNIGSLKLFNEIEMPLVEVLAEMQYTGVYADQKEIIKFGNNLSSKIEELRIDIYNLAGKEFNINSPKQLGEVLFEDLKLPVYKKNKSGYSTDVDVLEKLKNKHPIIEKILDYRQLVKLNSTYVEGLMSHINEKTGKIHTRFHQTVTATGRLSSTEPNLQNIPTRTDLGKKIRKVFKAEKGKILIDSDYSQIELRVLAHISNDEIMINAFNQDQDIHTICASQIFNVPVDKVSKQLRSRAKAVNFGIVYGISDFGLSEQTGINIKEAKEYIEQYLEKYSGIKKYMDDVVEQAKKKGYTETMFGRRRYIPEIKSNNYMVRKFGERAAMNTPIQGTAADIMKIAMIKVYKRINKENLKSKIILQIHDELLVEAPIDEADEIKKILHEEMESAAKLSVPLKVEVEEGNSWYQAK